MFCTFISQVGASITIATESSIRLTLTTYEMNRFAD